MVQEYNVSRETFRGDFMSNYNESYGIVSLIYIESAGVDTLLKLDSYAIQDGISITGNQLNVIETHTNAYGTQMDSVYPFSPAKISVQTGRMSSSELNQLLSYFRQAYTVPNCSAVKNLVKILWYDYKNDLYQTGYFTHSDFEFLHTFKQNSLIYSPSFTMEFSERQRV